jgi:formylglycine-generating enzyme required for sulfatase activity
MNTFAIRVSASFAACALALPAVAQTCLGDIAIDNRIDGGDLGVMLANWGPVTSTALSRTCDLDGNTVVNGADLGILLNGWGSCPGPTAPAWATLLEALPDPKVVKDPDLRSAIVATGFPWRIREIVTGMEMLLVPPGTFQMGCVMGSTIYGCDGNAEPVHGVVITRPFYLGRFEVTQAQWTQAMATNPAYFRGFPDSAHRPVESVSWIAVQSFLATTSFRLPTEAEWEFACRACTNEPFHNGLTADDSVSDIAWCAPLADTRTYAVGGKSPNMLGFHDMLGNVWELVADWYAEYRSESQLDPTGPASGSSRLRRGGSWAYYSSSARSYYRNAHGVDYLSWDFGLRVARNP